MKRKNSGQNGFTLIEVIVAAAIFSVFITSVFAFYRMGSRMFTSGSWKQQKQKDSEMFLNLIRERASRASFPVVVKNDGTFVETATNFGYASGTFKVANIPTGKTGKRLLCFAVTKSSIKGSAGVIMYHILRAVKSDSKATDFTLEFLSTTDLNSGDGAAFFTGSPFSFFTSAPTFSLFAGDPTEYNLGSKTSLKKITDITSLTLSMSTGGEGGTQLHITLESTHPKYENTKVTQRAFAKIPEGLTVIVNTI